MGTDGACGLLFCAAKPSAVLVLICYNRAVIRKKCPGGWPEPQKMSLGGGVLVDNLIYKKT
jgi:hypothetical protein